MIEQTQGIILRTLRYSDTSLIVHWITEEHGRITTMARGALRPKSAFRGKLDLFHQANLSFKRHPSSTLHALREFVLTETYPGIRVSLLKITQASYTAQLLNRLTEEDTPVPELYHLWETFLQKLNPLPEAEGPEAVLAFEFSALQELGLTPPFHQRRWSDTLTTWFHSLSEGASPPSLPTHEQRTAAAYLGAALRESLGRLSSLRRQALDDPSEPSPSTAKPPSTHDQETL